MTDIELVIKIDEEIYQHTREYEVGGFNIENDTKLFIAIKNGKPLPKGHGRLGDLDVLRKEISSWGMNDYEPSDFIDEIDMADVIIEADKAESEE